MDDAYITYRYASNLTNGSGLVFNPGSKPVEGFTSPLWLFLLYIAALICGVNSIPYCAIIMGLILFLFSLFIGFSISRIDGRKSNSKSIVLWSSLISVSLLAVMPATTFYAVTGMESLLFLSVVLIFSGAVNKSFSIKIGIIAGVLAIWIRPEGAWLPIMLVFQLFAEGRRKSFFRKDILILIGALAVGVVTLVLMRILIFGNLLPNTFFAKEPSLISGLLYVKYIFTKGWGLSILVLGILGAINGKRCHRGYFFAGLSWIVAVILEGGDWMPAGRFLLPALGLFALASAGIPYGGMFRKLKIRSTSLQNLVVFFIVFIGICINIYSCLEYSKKADWSYRNSSYFDRVLSDWLIKSNARSIASVDIGIIGFKTNAEIVDLGGLTDKYIGRSAGKNLAKVFDTSYIFEERKPDLLIIRISKPPEISNKGKLIRCRVKSKVERLVLSDKKLGQYYDFLLAILPPVHSKPYYGKLVFGRKDFKIKKNIIPKNRIFKFIPLD
jgi:hypothetical protein